MDLLRMGRRRQFERLVRPQLKPLFQMALRLTRQTEWAEDLTQDALIRAYERFHQFTAGTNFRAWLFTILTHLYLNDLEHARRRPNTTSMDTAGEEGQFWDFPTENTTDNPAEALLLNVLPEELQRALDRLPEEFRVAIILVDLQELAYQDAANALAIPLGTVRSRVSRGRAMMRRTLEQSETNNDVFNPTKKARGN